MVTIERKLSMFSSLLHRTINERMKAELEKLHEEYEVKARNDREAVDREAEDIVRRARKKAETEKTEMISRIRINMKRDLMAIKERLFEEISEKLNAEINKFIMSQEYGDYIASLAKKLREADELSNCLIIYMTDRDIEKYSESIKEELTKDRLLQLTFETADEGILGGFTAVNPSTCVRMDFSIKTLLEDSRPYMMQTLFRAIEAGESNGTE